MKNQRKYTDEILFDNYMVSSVGEEFVHCQIPFYFHREIYEKMIFYSETINRIAIEVLEKIHSEHKELLEYFEDFKYKDDIFSLDRKVAKIFWTRFDTFIDKEDNILFAELNYDKPCGQKEIHLAGKLNFEGNLNCNFIEEFKKELIEITSDFGEEIINVGILIDPCHYEELHHSYYFKDIFQDTNINIVQVGPNNLSVKNKEVYAFGEIKLSIILRLFPTEFSCEIKNYKEILESYSKGNVLILNDPRIIAIQSKGFLAYLWKLVKDDSSLILESDKRIIEKCIPYTKVLEKSDINEIIKNKDKYVLKSSLGRYSEEVYIGKSYTEDGWKKQIQYILKLKKIYVIQNLINIREEYTYIPQKENMNLPVYAYGNYGVYIIDKKVRGALVRWSREFLTDDNYTWMCPLGVKNYSISILEYDNKDRNNLWKKIMDEIAFKYSFTGNYTNFYEYVTLNSLLIEESLYNEMKHASKMFCNILKQLFFHIQGNIELFGPLLGIDEELYAIVSKSFTDVLCAIGRIDFVIDNGGNLKILEFNSETPAGLVEAINIGKIIKEKINIKYIDPNENLKNDIRSTLFKVIKDLSKKKNVENIAVVTSWYPEDIYTSLEIVNTIKELQNYNVIFGNVYDLKVKDEKLYLYGNEIDCIYRHYPLDWFWEEEEMRDILEVINSGDYLINPGYTLITQSKALFAVIYELLGKGFYNKAQEEFIEKYIPYTCIEPDNKLSHDCIAKPYLSREGLGAVMSYQGISKDLQDIVFQDRVNILPLKMNTYSSLGAIEEKLFPIMGAYISNDKMSGIYTRMGSEITDSNSIYIPTFIK